MHRNHVCMWHMHALRPRVLCVRALGLRALHLVAPLLHPADQPCIPHVLLTHACTSCFHTASCSWGRGSMTTVCIRAQPLSRLAASPPLL
eukprot:COSAG01_NODE_6061_length_3874_cov_1.743379_3_plen_90_part_00